MNLFHSRVVNILHQHMTRDNVDEIWSIVKEAKKNFTHSSNACSKESRTKVLFKSDVIKDIIDGIEQRRNLNSTSDLYKNVTQETFDMAAKMATYLFLCPSDTHSFYDVLFRTETPKNIVLAMLSMLKTTRNAGKIAAEKIVGKVAEKLKIDHFKNIDDLINGKCTTNCTDILEIFGKIFPFVMCYVNDLFVQEDQRSFKESQIILFTSMMMKKI